MSTQYRGNVVFPALLASAIVGALALWSLVAVPTQPFQFIISADTAIISVNESVTVTVEAYANTPANVFAGVIYFDANLFTVTSISYNTSIAELWTEEPWYNQGDGTVSFAGGTTKPGGFTGQGDLLTITLTPRKAGTATIHVDNAQILLHDGLGTAAIVETPDTLFTITDNTPLPPAKPTNIIVTQNQNQFDLTNDGAVTVADLSSFFVYFGQQNLLADFNGDEKVSLADMSMLLQAIRTANNR